MSEADLWERTREGMQTRWDVQRHEDKYSTGIPDVSFGLDGVDGWIELKHKPKMPPLQKSWDFGYKHFTADQRNWLTQRERKGGGRVFLMAYFESERITALWRWPTYRVAQMESFAFGWVLHAAEGLWQGPVDYSELVLVLRDKIRIATRVPDVRS